MLESTQSVALCWQITVDIPAGTAEPAYDTNTCQPAVMFGGDIMEWQDILDEYEETTDEG